MKKLLKKPSIYNGKEKETPVTKKASGKTILFSSSARHRIKTILYTLIGSLILIPYACEDALDLLPTQGQVKEEYWKNKEDIKAVLMGAYKTFAMNDDRLFFYGELRGDMLQANLSTVDPDYRNVMNSNIFPSNDLAMWENFYSIINYCNLVIKYLPEVKQNDATFDDFTYNAFQGEAVFLRSLAYFYLVRIFNEIPFVLQPYDTDNQELFLPKSSPVLVLDSLENQLEKIINLIPLDYESNDKTRGRATRGAVYSLLADIALWNFNYEKCIKYIEELEKIDFYELVPGGKWFSIFSEGNTVEGIFEIQFDTRNGQLNHIYELTRQQNNRFSTSTFAYELLAPKLSQEIVRGNGTINEETKLIWKYVGLNPDGLSIRPASESQSCNWIIYRLADVLLMKAEALSQLGQYDKALNIINQIRTRAFMPVVNLQNTPSSFEDFILEERARELAYEGKRWFDLMRMGRRNNYLRKDKLIAIIVENAPASQKRVLASKLSDPNGWYFPIHADEIENNPNLVQNPYYQVYE